MKYKRQIDLGVAVVSISFGVTLTALRPGCRKANVAESLLPM
jgi:hypothetical protein